MGVAGLPGRDGPLTVVPVAVSLAMLDLPWDLERTGACAPLFLVAMSNS
jgi:hypothetical protein